jgi:hypothetical protein
MSNETHEHTNVELRGAGKSIWESGARCSTVGLAGGICLHIWRHNGFIAFAERSIWYLSIF